MISFPIVHSTFSILKMIIVNDLGKTIVTKRLVFAFEKTEWYLTDERSPSAIGAPGANDSVA